MRRPRRSVALALQIAFVVLVFAFGGHLVAIQWADARGQIRLDQLRWGQIAAATALVYATYALLVQLWRFVLHLWDARLTFSEAVRVWTISSLGRYVPGRVAQIGAMALLARQRGVSAVAATGSSLLNTLVNLAAGVLVALATAGADLDRLLPGAARFATALVLLAAAGLVALPWLLPWTVGRVGRLLGRDIGDPRMPASAVWITALGNVVAWLLYGVAFRLFTAGVLGAAPGATSAYIAVYTGSYVVGYLAIFTPGGLGVREGALAASLTAFHLATLPQAALVAVASRLWLTVLEVLPGLLFLAHGAAVRRSSRLPRHGTP